MKNISRHLKMDFVFDLHFVFSLDFHFNLGLDLLFNLETDLKTVLGLVSETISVLDLAFQF